MANKGWRYESNRHRLASKGIKTGNLKKTYALKEKSLPYTSEYSQKPYRCDKCGFVSVQGTNHYGKIYNLRCPNCSWQNGMQPFVTMSCVEQVPKGMALPPEWTKCHLFLKKASIPDSKFNRKQLNEGIKVEQEHTNDKKVAKAIAKAHLSEDTKYYIKLKKAGL